MSNEENIKRISAAVQKVESDGFVYFIDSYPYTGSRLFRAHLDGSSLLQISRNPCKCFALKDGLIDTTEEYSEHDETGYLYDRYRDETTYRIDGEEVVEVRRSRGYLSSSN